MGFAGKAVFGTRTGADYADKTLKHHFINLGFSGVADETLKVSFANRQLVSGNHLQIIVPVRG